MTGTAVMASTNRLDSHILRVDIDGVSSFSAQLRLGHKTRGAKLTELRERCQDGIALGTTWFPFTNLAQDMDGNATMFSRWTL
jgi:hypothetical protein